MDEADQHSLQSISQLILDNVDAKYVVDHLIAAGVLEPDDDEEIRAEKTAKRRTEKLLDILPNTRPDALKHFSEALQKDYAYIVEKLNAVQVPDGHRGESSRAGMGGLRTAMAAAAAAAAPPRAEASTTNIGVTTTTTTRNSVTSRTTNITGNNNFVVVGGKKTTINYR